MGQRERFHLGWQAGYNQGYIEGFEAGYEEGFERGRSFGYNEGYAAVLTGEGELLSGLERLKELILRQETDFSGPTAGEVREVVGKLVADLTQLCRQRGAG